MITTTAPPTTPRHGRDISACTAAYLIAKYAADDAAYDCTRTNLVIAGAYGFYESITP